MQKKYYIYINSETKLIFFKGTVMYKTIFIYNIYLYNIFIYNKYI